MMRPIFFRRWWRRLSIVRQRCGLEDGPRRHFGVEAAPPGIASYCFVECRPEYTIRSMGFLAIAKRKSSR
jgi:hypothetical protein